MQMDNGDFTTYVENLVNICSNNFRGEKAVIASAEQRVDAILLTIE
jgi:hypothetical protein